jgi:Ca2+-binding RTX toxin-like protein
MATLFVGPGGYSTIQAAVDASNDGDTIVIAQGIYVEQVIVGNRDNLTLQAAAGAQVTIQAPADLVETARSSSDREIHAVLTVIDSLNVTIDNVDIDGHGAGNTVDEGGGAGIANFYGVYYRNSSGSLLGVNITGVRDPYPGGTTAGGHLLVDGVQRGVGLVVDNDAMLAFTMTGGSITDFQKQGATFVRADVTITGVTITGGGAQTVIAQNGISINRSTGTISGNTISQIGYAGPAGAYSGLILASSNTDLAITGNMLTGTNGESAASKVVGVWVYQNGPAISGGEVTGNTVGGTDVGIYVNDSVTPDPILIENNSVPAVDTTDANAAGVKLEQNIAVTTPFDTDGSQIADLLRGAAGNDILSGLAGNDTLIGNDGDDYLDGGSGDDAMSGGAGNDIFIVDSQLDTAGEVAAGGTDEVRTALAVYSMQAEANVENLTGTSATGQDLRANSGHNIVTTGAGMDIIRLQDGGNDTAYGMGGRDGFYMGGALGAGDYLDGGEGKDELILQGDYSTQRTLGANNLLNTEVLSLLSGGNTQFGDSGTNSYSYNLKTVDANVAAGQRLTVDFTNLLVGENVTFDGSAEMDGAFTFGGGKGVDTLTGGSGADLFLFRDEGRYGASDTVNGGAGTDELALRGNYAGANAIVFQANTMTNVEVLSILSGQSTWWGPVAGDFSYDLTTHDDNVAAGQRLVVDAGQLTAGEVLKFDGSAEIDGYFLIAGGAAGDTITGGDGNDTIIGGLGADDLRGGGGNDVFRYRSSAESTGASTDEILDFASGADQIDLSRIDANTFAAGDQAFAWIGSNAFSGSGAASAGQLRAYEDNGTWFVEGDTNGDGLADLVIQLTVSGGPLTQGDFIP